MKRVWITVMSLIISAGASAQWQWVDANGKRVFSDQPPPSSIPDSKILSKPAAASVTPAASPKDAPSAPAATPAADSSPATPTPDPAAAKKQAELEAQKKKAEDEQKAREAAEKQRQARIAADNCQKAKAALDALNTGTPARTFNAKGERVFMDENMRNTEKNRLTQIVNSECRR